MLQQVNMFSALICWFGYRNAMQSVNSVFSAVVTILF